MSLATPTDINLDDAQRWNALLQQAGIAVTAPIPEVDSFSQRGFLLRIEDLGEGIMLSDPIMVTVEFSAGQRDRFDEYRFEAFAQA